MSLSLVFAIFLESDKKKSLVLMEQKKDKRDIERGHCTYTYTYIYNILGNKWTFQSFDY